MINLSNFVTKKKGPVNYKGSVYVLTDCYYTGKKIISTVKGNREFYYLCLLFSRWCKDETISNRWRQIPLSFKKPDTELQRFIEAYTGEPFVLEKGQSICFETFSKELLIDIRKHNYNFRINWSNGKYPCIDNIYRLKECRHKAVLQKKIPGMCWPASALRVYPMLEANNIELLELSKSV